MSHPSRVDAEALDRADPLAPFLGRFDVRDPDVVYADGNSLGRPPHAVRDRVTALLDEWAERLVTGWADWIELPLRAGDLVGRVIGARPGETLVADSTTVNLYKLAGALLEHAGGRGALLTDEENFPTDRYVLDGLARVRGLGSRRFRADPVDGPSPDDVRAACASGDVALVCLSHVAYRSGARADMAAITAAAAETGTPVIWDLSHSAGALAVDVAAAGAELAVGCTYKYLCAGPGAPGWLYVRRDLQERLRSPLQGWFGQRAQFEMGPEHDPTEGIERFHAGTPVILGVAAVEAAAALVLEAGVEAVERKAASLTSLAVALADAQLAPLGFRLATPREPARRGAHVALAHADAWPICRALIERARVIPDFRRPDVVRLGFSPLTTRHADVWEAVDRLRRLVASGEHLLVDDAPARVT